MTSNNHPRAKALLEKFYSGKCSPEELALLEKWYNSLDEENQLPLSATQTEQYRQQFLAVYRSRLPRQKMRGLYRRPLKWMAAASILLLVGLGYVWLRPGSQPNNPVTKKEVFQITNGAGQVKQVLLPDSSIVWLNARASLSYEKDHSGNQRLVTLSGEGYFDVRHHAEQPFIITTRDVKVQVLGTAFNVEAYRGENMTRVSLVRGSVKLNAVADSSIQTVLQPGHTASFRQNATALAINNMNMEEIAAWRTGGFSINDMSVQDAVQRLCEQDGYTVQWMDQKDIQKTISVNFPKESFEQALGNLCYMVHKKYKITGTRVTIY